jgi:hypothetical protein
VNSSVSIAFPCRNRSRELRKTLDSIMRQWLEPQPMELIVVEDGDDGLTENLAKEFGARYIRRERTEAYPPFQSITEMWNRCLHAAQNDIVILQTPEVLHESPTVIADLVARVESGPKIMATPLIKDLLPDGSWTNWFNHPREGSRPGWISGAGPHAFNRKELLEVGGYEELFYGYGHEDDYFFYLLRRNGWKLEYVESAVTGHQWHERTKFEPVTGYANRALIRILTMEIEAGERLPLANRQPLEIDTRTTVEEVTAAVHDAMKYGINETFDTWATECWLFGNKNPDITFVAQRSIANEGMDKKWKIGEMVTEAAWAIIRAKEARTVALDADNVNLPHLRNWARRAQGCAEVELTWAARSLAKARELMTPK